MCVFLYCLCSLHLNLSSGKDRTVALKIVKSARHYTDAARDEVGILKKISSEDPDDEMRVVRLVDSFEHHGPNGNRKCICISYL